MNIALEGNLSEELHDSGWLWPDSVVGIGGGVADIVIAVENISGGNGKGPTVVSVHERKVDEHAAVDVLLVFRNAIAQAKALCHSVAGIAQKREAELVLVSHQR